MEWMNNFDWELFLQILTVSATIIGTVYKLLSSRAAKRQDTRGGKPKKQKKRRSDAGRRGRVSHSVFSKDRKETPLLPITSPVGVALPEGQPEPDPPTNYTEIAKTAVDWPEWDERSRTEQNIITETAKNRLELAGLGQTAAAYQQQAHLMNQQMGAMQSQLSQMSGPDYLSGIPNRTEPYWKAMYGNLGMGGNHFRGGK